jgi:hypothetical protein
MSEATANTAPGQPRAGLSTRCVHAGDTRDPQGAIHPPLYAWCATPKFIVEDEGDAAGGWHYVKATA